MSHGTALTDGIRSSPAGIVSLNRALALQPELPEDLWRGWKQNTHSGILGSGTSSRQDVLEQRLRG